jgi:hypothetical protein
MNPSIFPINIMSTSTSASNSCSTFPSIFYAASKEYKKKTGQDLRIHPLAADFDNCDTPDAVLQLFQKQVHALDDARTSDQTLMKWLNPTVHVLYMLSATLGEGVGLVTLVFPVTISSPINVSFVAVSSSKGHIYRHCRPSRCNLFSDTVSRVSCDNESYRLPRVSKQLIQFLSIFLNVSKPSSPVSPSILAFHSPRT